VLWRLRELMYVLTSKYSGNSSCMYYETAAVCSIYHDSTSVCRGEIHVNVYLGLEAKQTERRDEAHVLPWSVASVIIHRRISSKIRILRNWCIKLMAKNYNHYFLKVLIAHINSPITVTTRSKAWTVFAGSNAGIVGSNPTRGIDGLCVCVVLCVGRGLATGWSLLQGVPRSV
jgi:hypothetical protein